MHSIKTRRIFTSTNNNNIMTIKKAVSTDGRNRILSLEQKDNGFYVLIQKDYHTGELFPLTNEGKTKAFARFYDLEDSMGLTGIDEAVFNIQ